MLKNLMLALLLFSGTTSLWAKENLLLKRGEPFSVARERLLKRGWSPQITNAEMADGTEESSWGVAGQLNSAGYFEVELCSGTGLNYCFFNYKKGNRCLKLTTNGEYRKDLNSPLIYRWDFGRCKRQSK